jgi:hypothetical protein
MASPCPYGDHSMKSGRTIRICELLLESAKATWFAKIFALLHDIIMII